MRGYGPQLNSSVDLQRVSHRLRGQVQHLDEGPVRGPLGEGSLLYPVWWPGTDLRHFPLCPHLPLCGGQTGLEVHELTCYYLPMHGRPHTRPNLTRQRPRPRPKIAQTPRLASIRAPKSLHSAAGSPTPHIRKGAKWNSLKRFFALRSPAQLGPRLLRTRPTGDTNRLSARAQTHAWR